MKKNSTFLFAALLLGTISSVSHAAEPSPLSAYEQVSQALANDDLAAAQKAATDLKSQAGDNKSLSEHADAVAKSDSIKTARQHFKAVSTDAIKLAQGKPGYYVMTCPMAKGDWVQSNKQIRNPYMGKEMLECGMIKK